MRQDLNNLVNLVDSLAFSVWVMLRLILWLIAIVAGVLGFGMFFSFLGHPIVMTGLILMLVGGGLTGFLLKTKAEDGI